MQFQQMLVAAVVAAQVAAAAAPAGSVLLSRMTAASSQKCARELGCELMPGSSRACSACKLPLCLAAACCCGRCPGCDPAAAAARDSFLSSMAAALKAAAPGQLTFSGTEGYFGPGDAHMSYNPGAGGCCSICTALPCKTVLGVCRTIVGFSKGPVLHCGHKL